jgi:hypothetical protein
MGHVPTSIAMSIEQKNLGVIEAKMDEIKDLQGTIGPIANIEVGMWPELEASPADQAQDQQVQAQSEPEAQEQEEEPLQQDDQQEVDAQEAHAVEIDQSADNVQSTGSFPAIREEFQEIKAHLIRLTKVVESKESLTAPLTSVTAPSNGEISPMSTALLADALYLAWE